jgi:5-methylcytosine-specific restriction endonuclease McrA
MQTLVLNASDEPLCITGLHRAVVLALGGKADIVASNGAVLRSPSVTIPSPSVIRLRHYVRVPHKRLSGNPTLAGLVARDGEDCAYCIRRLADTIDHVHPKSRGGTHTWDNTVGACGKCNSRKSNKTVKEAGMTLRVIPTVPHSHLWLTLAVRSRDEQWEPYLASMSFVA